MELYSPSNVSMLAEQGLLQTSVDSESGFGRPLAVSTVARDPNRDPKYGYDDRGSFMENNTSGRSAGERFAIKNDDQMKLSFGGLDQSHTSDFGPQRWLAPGPSAEQMTTDPWANFSKGCDPDISCRSSLGILPAGVMDDLSSSILPVDMPYSMPAKPPKPTSWLSTNSSASQKSSVYAVQQDSGWHSGAQISSLLRGSSTDSGEWTDTAKQDSKGDVPLGRSHVIDTVKKRPVLKPSGDEKMTNVRASLAFGQDPIEDESEADASVHEVVIAEDELNQLDEDFGEFEELEASLTSYDGEYDVDQEKLSPDQDLMKLNKIYMGSGSIQQNDFDGHPYKGVICAGKESDMLSLLRTQKYRNDGSEIDTEDELEIARKSLDSEQCAENLWGNTMNNKNQQKLSRPGLEGWSSEENGNVGLRQSAEGDVVISPGDGGGGGDGTSSSESEDPDHPSLTLQSQQLKKRFQQNFQPTQPIPSQRSPLVANSMEQRVCPMGDDLSERSRVNYPLSTHSSQDSGLDTETSALQSKFFAHMGASQKDLTHFAQSMGPGLENSTFNLEDMLRGSEHGQHPGGTFRQEASGFNANDQDMHSKADPFACIDSSFGSFGLQPDSGSSGASILQIDAKKYVINGSPVYVDENGEGVTDLAFCIPLSVEAAEQRQILLAEKTASSDSPNSPDVVLDDNFFAEDTAKVMLDEDEKEFEKENIFIQEDNMAPASTPESWAYQSVMSQSHSKYSLTEEEAQAYMRISIGEFIGSKSEALGSLEFNYRGPRPEFGMKVTTPPHNRHPVALIDTQVSDGTAPDSAQKRTEGVGNEEGYADVKDTTFKLTDLDTPIAVDTKQHYDDSLTMCSTDSTFSGNTFISETASTCSSTDSTLTDQSAVMRVSEISRFLSTLSSDTKPQELADMIIELSNQKTNKDVKQTFKEDETSKQTETANPGQSLSEALAQKSGSINYLQALPKSLIPVRVGTSLSSLDRKVRLISTQTGAKVRSLSADSMRLKGKEKPLKNGSIHRSLLIENKGKKNEEIDSIGTESKEQNMQKTVPDGEESDNDQTLSISNVIQIASPELAKPQSYPNVEWHSPRPSLGGRYLDTKTSPKSQRKLSKEFDMMGDASNRPNPCSVQRLEILSDDQKHKITGSSVGTEKRDLSPADGEVSALFSKMSGVMPQTYSPPVRETSTNYRRENWKNASSLPSSVNISGELYVKTSGSRNERGIRSVSDNIAGHHMPDGTEYSSVFDVFNSNNNAGTRDEVVGTDDIKLVDSRVFDAITNSQTSGHISQASKSNDFGKYRSHDIATVTATDMYSSGTFPNVCQSSSVQSSAQLTTALAHWNGEPNMNPSCSAVTKSLPQSSVASKSQTFDTLSGMPVKNSNNVQLIESQQQNANPLNTHYWTQPQPPISSYRHNLLQSVQPPDKPTLLTKQSLQNTEFAKKYLQNCPEQMSTREDYADLSNMSLPLDQFKELRPSLSPPRLGHNVIEPHHDLSILAHSPTYQSTPFTKAVTGSRMALASTVLTASSMHTLWSTRTSPEMATPLTKTDNMYSGRRPEQYQDIVPTKPTTVETPGVLRFSDVCCVGISTKATLPLKNPTNRWLECILHMKNLNISGQSVPINQYFPFDMKQKVIIEPHTTEDITVIFMPKVPGVYVAQLQVTSQLFLTEQLTSVDRIPVSVAIQAIAEKPQIQVLTAGNSELDFGTQKWGSCRSLSLKLVNLGQAMIPLRLAMSSNQGSWHCFSFERTSGPDVSVISKSKFPDFPALCKSVINICLPGNTDGFKASPQEIKVYCRPPDKQWDRALVQRPLDRISARIETEVDTPSSAMSPISTVQLRAIVGMPKLHTPRNLKVLYLKAVLGHQVQEKFILKNVGNMNLEVSLSVPNFEDVLTINPSHIIIPSGKVSEASVTFSPRTQTPPVIETWLLMHEEPDGPLFEIQVKGEVCQEMSRSPAAPALISDKRFLSFGGVGIGRAVQQKVTVANKSERPVSFRVEINSESQDFQLQGRFGQSRDVPRTRDVVLKSLEKYSIHVLFAPSTIRFSSSKLVIRPYDTTVKYSIPLCGYGGVSSLVLEGVTMSDRDHYWADLGEIVCGEHVVRKLLVRNVGSRAAYVKVMSFQDMRCKLAAAPNRVIIEPNEFILKEKGKMTVAVVCSPSEKEVALCSDHKEVVAAVCFFYGDELSRQQYKRAVSKLGKKAKIPSQTDNLLRAINFDVSYMNDETDIRESEGVPSVDAQSDCDQFYRGISKLLLALTGEPCPIEKSLTWTPRVHTGTLQQRQKSQMSDVSLTAKIPVRDTDRDPVASGKLGGKSMVESPELCNNDTVKTWIIQPNMVVLMIPLTGVTKPESSRFQIVNFSNRPLRFELCWPGHWFSVTPENGIVEPRSPTTVCISTSVSIHSNSEDFPWNGTIQVTCDGKYKLLPVQIRANSDKGKSFNGDLGSELMSLSTRSVTPSVLFPPDTRKSEAGLQLSTVQVTFPPIVAGDASESFLEIINKERHSVQWVISSFAPAYVKEGETSRDIFRATYKVFEIKDQFGSLAPKHSTKINIQFMPRSRGAYSQYWEVQSKSDSHVVSSGHKVRVQLSGEATSKKAKEKQQQSENRHTYSRKAALPEPAELEKVSGTDYKPVVVNGSQLDLPTCRVNQQAFCKIELKNQSADEHAVEVSAPCTPFYIKHSRLQMKSRRYLKFPVEFRPSSKGIFNSRLVFRINNSYDLTVDLQGECV